MNQFYKLIKVDIEKYGGDTIQEWWDRHTPEEQKKLLVEECEKLEARLRQLDEALAHYKE